MPAIFISYRREDAIAYSGRLYDRLSAEFGKSQVFMDIDSIEPGADFIEVIEQTVAACDAVLVVIGRHWLSASDEQGRRRIENPEDFVRLEVATALSRKVRVVPILVGGAQMPRSDELPAALSGLSRRHALDLPDHGFHQTLERLIASLRREEVRAHELAEQERLAREATAREQAELERAAREAKAREQAEQERLAREAKAQEQTEKERRVRETKDQQQAEEERLIRVAEARRLREARERAEQERLALDAQVRERVGPVLSAYRFRLDFYYQPENAALDNQPIPVERRELRNARSSCLVPPDEPVIAIIDCRSLPFGSRFIVFGRDNVYFRTGELNKRFAYSEIRQMHSRFDETGILLLNEYLRIDLGRSRFPPTDLLDFLQKIQGPKPPSQLVAE
jgi:hypothetical protein